jgi:hypothetical protein
VMTELPCFVARILTAYKDAREATTPFWDSVPQQIKQWSEVTTHVPERSAKRVKRE